MAKKISGSVGKGGKNKPEDTVVVQEFLNASAGNPAPSMELTLTAPSSSVPQTAIVAYPIGEDFEFRYDPAELGAVESLEFLLDVLPVRVEGTARVDISLAILQGELFVAPPRSDTPGVTGAQTQWTTLSQSGLRAEDFVAVDGGGERPDFGLPIEFGYLYTADFDAAGLDVVLQLDNFEATVNTVPEPTAAALVLVLVLAAALLWRRVGGRRSGGQRVSWGA